MFPTVKDYDIFCIPKRKGGYRKIEAPNPKLKEQQRNHLRSVLYKTLPYSPFSHAYIKNRSIITNALPHKNKKYILKMDINNFFPSITWDMFKTRVGAAFSSRNKYRCMSEDERKSFLDECRIHFFEDETGEIRLPQGAPASPCIANFYLSLFDMGIGYRLCKGLSNRVGVDIYYTRYADDITLSSDSKSLLRIVEAKILEILPKSYGLTINSEKSKLIPRTRYQIVCGIKVNGERLELAPRYKHKIEYIKRKLEEGKTLTKKEQGLMSYYNMLNLQDKLTPITWRTYDEYQQLKQLFK